jgi:DNA-binding NarL/FixJ family response regulator
VVVIDDHEAVRAGLRATLDATPDLRVIGESGSADEALALVAATTPDLAIVDLALPDRDGIHVCRELASTNARPHCVVLTSYSDEEALLAAAVAGARAYVLKSAPSRELVQTLRRVGAGELLLDANRARARLNARLESDPRVRLSPHERMVLALVADGLSNREIGARRRLTEKTVKNYVSRILTKLDLQRRTQAAVLAARMNERERLGHAWRRPAVESMDH